jgi:hypothetical protein
MMPFDPRLPIIAEAANVKTCHVFHCWQAMREMGKQFHIAAFAAFAGLEPRHIERIIKALENHNAIPGPKREAVKRGDRLSMDWSLPEDWLNWAIEQRRWTPGDAKAEALMFADYWQSKAGQQAVKLDWRKTWQNWVRQSRRPDGAYRAPPVHMANMTAEQLRSKATEAEAAGLTFAARSYREQLAALEGNVIEFPNKKAAQ